MFRIAAFTAALLALDGSAKAGVQTTDKVAKMAMAARLVKRIAFMGGAPVAGLGVHQVSRACTSRGSRVPKSYAKSWLKRTLAAAHGSFDSISTKAMRQGSVPRLTQA